MTDRIRTVDMSDPTVVLDCYRKLNVAYKELKAENKKLRAALLRLIYATRSISTGTGSEIFSATNAAAAALKEAGDE